MRAVIGLEGNGLLFRDALERASISRNLVQAVDYRVSELDFVYNELISQILMAYGPDKQVFLNNILHLPDYKLLQHIYVFQDVRIREEVASYFKEFALFLMFQFERFLTNTSNEDYLLEAVNPDYIIISTYPAPRLVTHTYR